MFYCKVPSNMISIPFGLDYLFVGNTDEGDRFYMLFV